MFKRRCSYAYGVDAEAIECFVHDNQVVKEFLGRYQGRSTYVSYSRVLAWFFRWLHVVKGLDDSPEELLNEHVGRRSKVGLQERNFVFRLVLEFCRDNPDFAERADSYRRGLFNVIKQFFSYHSADLTNGNVWNGRCCRKFSVQQLSVEQAKKVLALLGQREKTICLIMIQSGMSIGDVLDKFNGQFDVVERQLTCGANRIKVEFKERKKNNFEYFTFIGADSCQEMRVWLRIREAWLAEAGRKSKLLFITRSGQPLTRPKFECLFYQKTMRLGLKKQGAFSFRSHMFRRMFKTESSPPERGINADYVEFMMGHRGGIRSVGGTYDRTPEIYANVVEKEYEKLEGWVNIYSGKASQPSGLNVSEEDLSTLRVLLQKFKEGKVKIAE